MRLASQVSVICTLSCCGLLSACRAAEDGASPSTARVVTVRDSAGIRILESNGTPTELDSRPSPFLLDSIPEVSIGEESGEELYLLHRVYDAERLADGRILIGNSGSHEVRVYSASGEHLKNIGRKGSGPGEFGEYATVRMLRSGDTLLLDDTEAQRVHVLAPTLEITGTRPFRTAPGVTRPFLRGAFADGTWLGASFESGRLNGPPGQIIRATYALLHYSADGEFMDSIGAFPSQPRVVNEIPGGGSHFPFIPLTVPQVEATRGDSVVVMRGTAPELEVYDQSGLLVQLVRWPRERIRSADVYPAFKESRLRELETELNMSVRARYTALYEKDLPIPEYAPLYMGMIVDDARRVWLERYRDDNAQPRIWEVIDTDGAWLGTVTLPPRWALYRAGTDYVLGRALDTLGVLRVQVYRMQQAMP